MPTTLFYGHGWPDAWTPTVTANKIISIIEQQVEKNFPNKNNLVVDTTWINELPATKKLKNLYSEIEPIDNLFLCSIVDHILTKGFPYPTKSNYKLYKLGAAVNDQDFDTYFFDFWSISMADLFQHYDEKALELKFDDLKHFLCFQNKPHLHRQLFTSKVINAGLLDKGILTLQKYKDQPFVYSNLTTFDVEESIDRKHYLDPSGMAPQPIENDHQIVYTLGDLNIWNNCFLNVVGETLSVRDINGMFLTEKTIKPIIGMRPFIINGNPKILKHLRNNGFYTFEEYWPTIKFRDCTTMEDTVSCCVAVLRRLCQKNTEEINQMYNDMYKKLLHNRNRFFEYAKEQENQLYRLFES